MPTKSLKRNLSWTTIGMVLYNFAIWVLSALILRMLGAEASGNYAIAMSIGNTLYALSLWGMRGFIVSDQSKEYSYAEYCGARILSIGLSLVILIVIMLFSMGSHYDLGVLFFYTVFKLCEAMIELMDCFMQQQKQMDINAKSMILRSVLFIAAFYCILKITQNLTLALAVLVGLSICVFLFYNLKLVRKQISLGKVLFNQRTKSILRLCFPIMGFEMCAAAVLAIPKLIYEPIGDLATLGIYNSIYTLVIFLQLVINVLIYTFAPYMAEAYQKNDHKKFMKYMLILFLGSIGLGLVAEVLVYFLGGPVIGMLYGAKIAPYFDYLYIGILSGVTLTWTWMFSQLFTIMRHTYDQLICSIASIVACWIFSKLFITTMDCNRISLVIIGANCVFIIVAAGLLFARKRREKTA